MAAIVVRKNLESILSRADTVAFGTVRTVSSPELKAPPYQEIKSPDFLPKKYTYKIADSEAYYGNSTTEFEVSYYYRGDLKVSYEETGTGIENALKENEKYVFIMRRLDDATYELLRADLFDGFDVSLLEEILHVRD